MVLGTRISSARDDLSPEQVLYLANFYLENARKETDPNVVLVLCFDAEISLLHLKRSKYAEDKTIREGMSTTYADFGDLLQNHGHRQEAQGFYKKSKKWGGRANNGDPLTAGSTAAVIGTSTSAPPSQPIQGTVIAKVAEDIFPRNLRLPPIAFKPPELDSRLKTTLQLAFCLGLLESSVHSDDVMDPHIKSWLELVREDSEEQERLKSLATRVIRAFKSDEFKDSRAVTEVMQLAPVLDNDDHRYLLREFYSGIEKSFLLEIHQLEGLAQLIQSAGPGQLDSDDLVKVLDMLSSRLRDTHQQSPKNLYQLVLAVSHVLDAMADAQFTGLDRRKLHEPLLSSLEILKKSSDTYLVYQAAYAFQALLCVPDDESLWNATLRRTGKVIKGVSRLVSAVKGLDLNAFIDGLGEIQQGVAGAMEVVKFVKDTYDDVSSLVEGGKNFVDCLKEGLSFNRRCAWYPALRGADTLIQEGQFADLRKLVCEAPCRQDPAFQWGVCQRLGEVAANTTWDSDTRRGAIAFLGEIYRKDEVWGRQARIKQWILNILMQLSNSSEFAHSVFQELRQSGDAKKQALYRSCQENAPRTHLLKVVMTTPGRSSLLDRVQEKPDVESYLRQLRRQRLERDNNVYITPQANFGTQFRDDELFPLMEKVKEFLVGSEMVFLLLGDSGAGKSTFNRELEFTLWESYNKNGPIPLHISLPAIEKPEHDMIAKQLRKIGFTEPQIRELKQYRKFILICDGYDESQQTHNLYMSNRLNQTGEWNAKMIISCRSEYLGSDYRDRFQPGDRNHISDSELFQEAVMAPFSLDQVQEYINQYVSIHRPLWDAKDYKQALDRVPSLKDLVKNPFLMSLALEVLPRMVDPGQHASATRITKVALYDHFIEHWLERNKRRLGEKNLNPQAKAAFDSLCDEGFTPNGIDFLKKLSVAIYKNQNGQPIVRYSRYKDENTWKYEFFSRDEEKQLLREACPLTRSGNQYRFIHRSLLEYGLVLAIFDPQEWKERLSQESMMARRGSVDSALSFLIRDTVEDAATTIEQEAVDNSPLVWGNFVGESSIVEFLRERAHHEPLFKQQLLDYVEYSKSDKKWRTAAANAITILVRAGIQFNQIDLQGIQIPGADISYGVFESAQLQGADMRQVDFRGAWLQDADLSNAQMTNARFGELPYLEHVTVKGESECLYSLDGKWLFVTGDHYNPNIFVYSTSTWDPQWTLKGHTRSIRKITYSPKGGQLTSAGRDRTVRLWDIEEGVCRHVLSGHTETIDFVAYSPEGDRVVSASWDKTIKLWDVESGHCLHTFTDHTGAVNHVVYSPKGDQFASSSKDETVRLWGIENKECCHILSVHNDADNRYYGSPKAACEVTYSPQGDQVVSVYLDVRLWDARTGDCIYVLPGSFWGADFITHSAKGDQIISNPGNLEKVSVRLWDTGTGMYLRAYSGVRPGANDLMYYIDIRELQLWDMEAGVCRQALMGHSYPVILVAFSPKGDQAASCDGSTIRLWDIGREVFQQRTDGHKDKVVRIILSPKGNQIATLGVDSVRLWDVETGMSYHTLQSYRRGSAVSPSCIAYSPQGDQIAIGSDDYILRLWNTETGACGHTLTGHEREAKSAEYSPDGSLFASGSLDKTIRLWDVATGDCKRIINTGGFRLVESIAFSPSGQQIAAGCNLGSVLLLNIETEDRVVLNGHRSIAQRVMFSPQGNLLFSAGDPSALRLWDVSTGNCRNIFKDFSNHPLAFALSPKGDRIAYGCKRSPKQQDGTLKLWDGTVEQWDVASETCLHTLIGHTGDVLSVQYSARGDLIVSGGKDKTVRLWDSVSGQCRAVIEGFEHHVNDVAWIEASDSNYIAACDDDGFVGAWQVIVEGDQVQMKRRWRTTKGGLNLKGALIQDAQGLSQRNYRLLKQREAIGDPNLAFYNKTE